MRGRRDSSDERLGMGAKLGRYISIRPLLHTSVISSSISIILLGAMIKTKAQQPHASTDVAPTMGGLWSRPPGCTACGSWPLGNHEETAQNARSQERLPTNCGAKDGRWCCAGCASTAGGVPLRNTHCIPKNQILMPRRSIAPIPGEMCRSVSPRTHSAKASSGQQTCHGFTWARFGA